MSSCFNRLSGFLMFLTMLGVYCFLILDPRFGKKKQQLYLSTHILHAGDGILRALLMLAGVLPSGFVPSLFRLLTPKAMLGNPRKYQFDHLSCKKKKKSGLEK